VAGAAVDGSDVDRLADRMLDVPVTPLVVCVSADPAVRERVARQLAGGVVVFCPDLDALRAILGAGPPGAAAVLAAAGAGYAPDRVVAGDLELDPANRLLRWRGAALPLTRIECELVARLATPPQRVWRYESLYTAVWGGTYLGDNGILHSAVKRLRNKFGVTGDGVRIETVRGVGYRLTCG
jgi:DNA-binding response OmpR family regulator